MTEKEILQKIIQLLKTKRFGMQSPLTNDSKIKMFSEWDSLKHLMFLMEIEKKFNIEISPEEITSMLTLGDVIRKIKTSSKRNGNQRARRNTKKK